MTADAKADARAEPSAEPWYWSQFEPGGRHEGKFPPGDELALLRQGLTVPAGAVHGMWRHYRTSVDDDLAARGLVQDTLIAEHMTLALFAMHQQGKGTLVHARGARLGTAARALHERFSVEGVDGRMAAAAQARSLNAVFFHLRGLISQLATTSQPLDYTQLLYDLRGWPYPDTRARTVRAWGSTYHVWTPPTDHT
ncbi:type I-E CRISPR-associated protein Cse2/CasB [Streptomyces sp. NPDC032472]|uniref:type I-E CRISPR-associated protein Cse2/CasB n=1 Tax=Streptomyces sp. NPDC032472 TaxID=3155018 RepID=UPI00340DCBA6